MRFFFVQFPQDQRFFRYELASTMWDLCELSTRKPTFPFNSPFYGQCSCLFNCLSLFPPRRWIWSALLLILLRFMSDTYPGPPLYPIFDISSRFWFSIATLGFFPCLTWINSFPSNLRSKCRTPSLFFFSPQNGCANMLLFLRYFHTIYEVPSV